jgi:RNA polymerase sigma-70 factor (ECF subfamily)
MNRPGSHPDASALLRRSRRGDEASARALLSEVAPAMRLYARAILRDHDLAEDAVQAALLAVFDATTSDIDAVRDAKGWLLAVTRRKAVSIARSETRRRSRELRAAHPRPSHVSHDEFHRVREAITQLPRRLREVIVLTSACGLTLDQTAHAMNANRNTVAWWKRQALDKLRAAMSPEPARSAPIPKATHHG